MKMGIASLFARLIGRPERAGATAGSTLSMTQGNVARLEAYPIGVPIAVLGEVSQAARQTETVIGKATTVSELRAPIDQTVLVCGTVGIVRAGTVIIGSTGTVTGEVVAKLIVVFGTVGQGMMARLCADHIIICSGARITKTQVFYRESHSLHRNVDLIDVSLIRQKPTETPFQHPIHRKKP